MIYIGTSGWNYFDWQGKFYPEDLKPRDYLKYYSRHFQTVEINYSFYHLPRPSTYQNWHSQTPQNFIFSVKASRFITHIKRLKNTKMALKTFLENSLHLKEKLGPVLFQFPPNFKATEENIKRLENFFKSILRTSDVQKLKLAFEFRHRSWCNEEIYKLLQKYNVAWVIADSPNYPKVEITTADFVYVRMHGSKILFGSKYTAKEIRNLAQKIKKWRRKVKDAFIYFNNDFAGYAVENAKELKELLVTGC